MQYLKGQRVFQMNGTQKAALSDPQRFYQLQQVLMAQYAQITVIPQNDCFQLAINSNVPLPQRKEYWKNILQIVRGQIGMSLEM